LRKSFLFVIGLLVMVASIAAQTHDNMKEAAVSDSLVFSADVRVGTTMVPAGEYRVSCDRETITFTRKSDGQKIASFKCQGKDLGKKADETQFGTATDAKHVRFLETLTLRGSTIEHTFN
jgi:hypothetical protein